MVANITTGKDVYGALAYNQEKVDRGDGKVLLTHIVREPTDGRFNVAATAEDLLRWMPSHYRTEKPVVHVSLNPAPEDRLDDGQLAEIAGAYMERMGLGRTTLYRIQAYRHRTGAYPYRVGAGGPGRAQDKRQQAQRTQRGRYRGTGTGVRTASRQREKAGERARDRPRRLHAGRPETPGGSGNKTGRGDIPLPDPRRVPGIAVPI